MDMGRQGVLKIIKDQEDPRNKFFFWWSLFNSECVWILQHYSLIN